jgi:very-short-patch-repair endonuclease
MFVELASVLGLVDLVVVGDALLRLGLTTRRDLVAYCAASPAQHAGDARRAAAYVRDRVDSPMETRLRMLLVLAGLPEPEVNLEVVDAAGLTTLRLDLAYADIRLAVEYDGRQHAEDTRQWGRDLKRREWLDDQGWKVIVVTAEGMYGDPAATLVRVLGALAARGRHVPVARLSEEWRPFFPVR